MVSSKRRSVGICVLPSRVTCTVSALSMSSSIREEKVASIVSPTVAPTSPSGLVVIRVGTGVWNCQLKSPSPPARNKPPSKPLSRTS